MLDCGGVRQSGRCKELPVGRDVGRRSVKGIPPSAQDVRRLRTS